jgi:uncharacterized delta-60 repeat protein
MIAGVCAVLPVPVAAQAAPGDVDLGFGDRGILRPPPAVPSTSFEETPDIVGGGGGILLLRGGVACWPSCGQDLYLTRFRGDGSLDGSFGESGTATVFTANHSPYPRAALATDPTGRPLVAADTPSGVSVARLNRDGSFDRSFGAGGIAALACDCEGMSWLIANRRDGGAALLGLRTETVPGYPSPVAFQTGVLVIELLADGSLDPSFGSGGQARTVFPENHEPGSFTPMPDGSFIGVGTTCCREQDLHVVRIGPDGRADPAFEAATQKAMSSFPVLVSGEPRPGGVVPRPGGAFDLFGAVSSRRRGFGLRFRADGTLDPRFAGDGMRLMGHPIDAAVSDRFGRVFALSSPGYGDKELAYRLRKDLRPDPTFGGGRPVALPFFGTPLIQGGTHPIVYNQGASGCRGYCPPKPEALRFEGGTSRVRCLGAKATIVGTAAGETLFGTPGRDVIAGLGGNDRIRGGAGVDLICGGRGHDRLGGGEGRDRLRP